MTGVGVESDGASLRAKRPRLAGLIVGAVALTGVIAFILHVGDIGAFAETALKTDARWLAVALAAQALAFLVQALIWALVLSRRKISIRRGDLFVLSLGKLFADQAIPSAGVSGAVFLVHALTRRGISAADSFTTFVFGGAASILAFIVFASGALVYVTLSGGSVEEFSINISDLHFIAIAAVMFIFVVAALYFASHQNGAARSSSISKVRETVREAVALIYVERGLFSVCLGLQAIARLLDCVTLWIAFQALGGGVTFLTSVLAVSLASLAATIAPTPMGLGSFEAGLIAALASQGVGIETALAGGLIYRGLSLGLPLFLGFFVVQRELLKR